MQDLAQQPGQQRDKGHADQGNAAARDQLLHALALGSRVVLTVTFQKVDNAPETKTCAQGHYESLQNTNCAVEK